jgi:hypothetical protein
VSKTDKTPLSVMMGSGDFFYVRQGKDDEKSYVVEPLLVEDVDKFIDGIHIGNAISNMIDTKDSKNRATLSLWLSKQVKTADGEPLTLDIVKSDHWTVVDLKLCLRKICDISG